MLDVVNQNLKRATVDRLNNIGRRFNEIQHPLKDFILIHQIAGVNRAELVAVKGQRGQRRQVVFLFDSIVARLHKVDVFLLALVVDVLQLVEDLLWLFVTLRVCWKIFKN